MILRRWLSPVLRCAGGVAILAFFDLSVIAALSFKL
jgi:hypothetical protein